MWRRSAIAWTKEQIATSKRAKEKKSQMDMLDRMLEDGLLCSCVFRSS